MSSIKPSLETTRGREPLAPYRESAATVNTPVEFSGAADIVEQRNHFSGQPVLLKESDEKNLRPVPRIYSSDKKARITIDNAGVPPDAGHKAEARQLLLQQVYKRLQLRTDTAFDIVDAAAVGIKFNRNLQISSADYQGSLGSLEIEQGAFDFFLNPSISQNRDFSYETGSIRNDSSTLSLDLARLFRTGIRVSAKEDVTRLESRASSPQRYTRELSESNLRFQVMVPLLKGRGRISTAGREISAELDLRAAGLTSEHACAATIKSISDDYWNYLLSIRLLKIAIDAECRSREILDDTRVLVDKEAKPRSLLNSLEADLATKRAQRYSREQTIFESRNQLAFNLGIPVRHAAIIPVPTMDFPQIAPKKLQHLIEKQNKLYAVALQSRKDLRAAALSLESSKVLEEKARRDILPELNLTLGTNLHGWDDGINGNNMADAFSHPNRGHFYGLTLNFPLQNNAAKGRLRTQTAQNARNALLYQDHKERVYNEASVAVSNLYQAHGQLTESQVAAKMFRHALNDEIESFQLGKSTIFNILDAQDRLNEALSSVASQQTSVAKAVMNLRYQAGILFGKEDDGRKTLSAGNFLDLPVPEDLQGRQ